MSTFISNYPRMDKLTKELNIAHQRGICHALRCICDSSSNCFSKTEEQYIRAAEEEVFKTKKELSELKWKIISELWETIMIKTRKTLKDEKFTL